MYEDFKVRISGVFDISTRSWQSEEKCILYAKKWLFYNSVLDKDPFSRNKWFLNWNENLFAFEKTLFLYSELVINIFLLQDIKCR